MAKPMICIDCGMRIWSDARQAKRHGWDVWVGGARCKRCVSAPAPAEPTELDSPPFCPTTIDALAARGFERVNRHAAAEPKCAACGGMDIIKVGTETFPCFSCWGSGEG